MLLQFGGWNRFSGYTVSSSQLMCEAEREMKPHYPAKGLNYSVSPEGIEFRFKLSDVIMNGNYRAKLRLDKSDLAFIVKQAGDILGDAEPEGANDTREKGDAEAVPGLLHSIISALREHFSPMQIIEALGEDNGAVIASLLRERLGDLNADAVIQLMGRLSPSS